MEGLRPLPQKVRFGRFALDMQTGEIHRNGVRIRLPDQPFRVLTLLLERSGEIVTRDDLRLKLWPADTFVDFDHGLNNAINRIREVLGDSAESPRFIETLPRRGYRFIASLDGEPCAQPAQAGQEQTAPITRGKWIAVSVGGIVIVAFALAFALNIGSFHTRSVGGPAGQEITSIAVLPFENLTGDPQEEYIVDGIHDELITQLAQVGSLKVISRTSVMRYKDKKLPLRQIAHELDVEGILEGAVRRNGDLLHVTAQLISARDDGHIWARSYDREMREAPALPGEVARAVAEKLNAKLTGQERNLLGKANSVDPAVYTAYLKGRFFAQKMTNEGYHKAIEYYREAVDTDPGYAPAWAAMGASYQMLSGYGIRRRDLTEKDAIAKAKAAVERAIALDPALPKPYRVLGTIELNEWDWEGAARDLQRARLVEPEWEGNSYYLILAGRFDQAVARARLSTERNPLSYGAQLTLGWTYFHTWRFEESIGALKKAVEMESTIHHAHYELAWNYAKMQRFNEAVTECQLSLELLRRKRPEAVIATECGWVYGMAGRRREALEIAQRLEKTVEEFGDYADVAHIYDAVGQRENALRFLEKAYHAHDPWLPRQWTTPMVSEELRNDPRFQALIRRTGIPWARFPLRGESIALAAKSPSAQSKP
jgi:TolB-like protein/DNA-binding winged helix-turn-helix (wHTH) protein/Flp pilus assembly protein TadD